MRSDEAQVSEFSFVPLPFTVANSVFPKDVAGILLLVVALSIRGLRAAGHETTILDQSTDQLEVHHQFKVWEDQLARWVSGATIDID